ncbi:hypothetical protein P153DRAFT_356795 [Dothidotthia symphoricarpi CBS 119687]|uniref:Uncharacterized protein n=1 Tax=Dothidotthia symphoricarpi CBS 119687 TaxID=1392245 RepID=A0A6A6AE75_9PLEO|nr:uncharacterized protein P153DRAFT_356795 [Dothidotthia symphoricarpi CBS 119687]KAF2130159.1 hypothetical protein P153DRAFT_356795 [Dothidotthia symphoricarpi CBS 119687]
MWEPFGTSLANETASWRSGPNERGTLRILTTCILTLVLCVWTTLHLNIPDHTETRWSRRLMRGPLWVLIGIFAPEFVAYIACKQWWYAGSLRRKMCKLFGDRQVKVDQSLLSVVIDDDTQRIQMRDQNVEVEEPRAGPLRRHLWTKTHSHLALMGGFVFDTSKLEKNFFPQGRTRLTLTAAALRTLAEYDPDLIPDISEGEIKDKSKADHLGKTLVCLQAIWFIVQTVGRMAASFPISLLELNTFLHALCCLVVYTAWWNKPLDIQEPFIIDVFEDRTRKICASMVMNSPINYERHVHGAKGMTARIHHFNYMKDKWPSSHNITIPASSEEQPLRLYSGQMCFNFRLDLRGVPDSAYIKLHPTDIECFRLAQNYMNDEDNRGRDREEYRGALSRPIAPMTYTSDYDLDSLSFGILERFDWPQELFPLFHAHRLDHVLKAGSMIIAIIYGGCHLLAWNGPFRTTAEKTVWLVSCFVIISPLPLTILFFALVALLLWVNDFWSFLADKDFERCRIAKLSFKSVKLLRSQALWDDRWIYLSLLFCSVSAMCYIAARVYLIVECFINLAHLPDKVYEEPEWSQFLPHLGAG